MLVVTRKKDEKLIIGNEIEIQVLRIGRDNVRLGIKAPPTYPSTATKFTKLSSRKMFQRYSPRFPIKIRWKPYTRTQDGREDLKSPLSLHFTFSVGPPLAGPPTLHPCPFSLNRLNPQR